MHVPAAAVDVMHGHTYATARLAKSQKHAQPRTDNVHEVRLVVVHAGKGPHHVGQLLRLELSHLGHHLQRQQVKVQVSKRMLSQQSESDTAGPNMLQACKSLKIRTSPSIRHMAIA